MSPLAPRPALRDALLIAGSIGFVSIGVLLAQEDPRQAVLLIVFFGTCGAAGVHRLWRRRRAERSPVPPIAIGVRHAARRTPVAVSAVVFAGVGGTLAVFGDAHSFMFQALGALVAVLGLVLLAAVVTGRTPRGAITRRPDGLHVDAGAFGYVVPFGAIAFALESEMQSQPYVRIVLDSPGAVLPDEPEHARRIARTFTSNERWFDAQVALQSRRYGLDPSSILGALEESGVLVIPNP